jgi:hypothetical protein
LQTNGELGIGKLSTPELTFAKGGNFPFWSALPFEKGGLGGIFFFFPFSKPLEK